MVRLCKGNSPSLQSYRHTVTQQWPSPQRTSPDNKSTQIRLHASSWQVQVVFGYTSAACTGTGTSTVCCNRFCAATRSIKWWCGGGGWIRERSGSIQFSTDETTSSLVKQMFFNILYEYDWQLTSNYQMRKCLYLARKSVALQCFICIYK